MVDVDTLMKRSTRIYDLGPNKDKCLIISAFAALAGANRFQCTGLDRYR